MPPPLTRVRTPAATPVDGQEFLESLGEPVSSVVAEAFDAVEEVGARMEWTTFGATVKVVLEKTRMVGAFERLAVKVAITRPSGFPADPFDRAKAIPRADRRRQSPSRRVYYRVGYEEASPQQLHQVVEVLVDIARELTDRVGWQELPSPHEETFVRNDYNVWLPRAPGLNEFVQVPARTDQASGRR